MEGEDIQINPVRVLLCGHAASHRLQRAGHLVGVSVLWAEEELGWRGWFEEPLARERGRNAKVRLHDTIKWLNQHPKLYLVHVKGDGTGMRVGWELRCGKGRT